VSIERARGDGFGLGGSQVAEHPSRAETLARPMRHAAAVAAAALAGWAFLAWLAIDMGSAYAQLTMPADAGWSVAEALAIYAMWAVMMAAMMLPSALPMVRTFVDLAARRHETARAAAFVAAYVAVWWAFSALAVAAQWALQRLGWTDPMMVSRSAALNAALLAVAGAYQFSPLKRLCLGRCRSPLGFLVGAWRPGAGGAFAMGVRHGLNCVGCCWAMMALLFVGGVMNLAWVAALSVAVAIEKMLPGGERIAAALGIALIAAGAWKLVAAWG
jgi:predicted metal-binding membrane protein